MIEDAIFQYSQLGFSYAVSAFLLWRGSQLAEKFGTTLTKIDANLLAHTEATKTALEYLQNRIK